MTCLPEVLFYSLPSGNPGCSCHWTRGSNLWLRGLRGHHIPFQLVHGSGLGIIKVLVPHPHQEPELMVEGRLGSYSFMIP